MGPLSAINHLLNLVLPSMALAALAAALAKLLWRRELKPVTWFGLAWPAGAAGSVVALAGVVVFDHDGRMATTAAVVLACALTLWWRGFGPGRR